MLVLSRRQDEAIMGDDIEVVVLAIRGSQVRIGVIAPKEMPVHRKEVYEEIQEEKENS